MYPSEAAENYTQEKALRHGCTFEVRMSDGSPYICVEIKHAASRYSDRTVFKRDGDYKARICRIKTELLTRFQTMAAMGAHHEQYYNKGDVRAAANNLANDT